MYPQHQRHLLRQAVQGAFLIFTMTSATLGFASTAFAEEQKQVSNYQIKAGTLEQVLSDFAGAAGVSITLPPTLVDGRTSTGLRGSYSVQQGFNTLLTGTGLQVVNTTTGVYLLQKTQTVSSQKTSDAATLPEVQVSVASDKNVMSEETGSYTVKSSATATRFNLSLRETPQSVSIITRQQMDDQGLTSIADVLQQTPGITVNRENTEGYSFYVRGFQVQNFQFDGVPSLSSDGGNVRDNYSITNAAIYDRVEVLKGATGLLNGAGYPSGVINFVRKRPTAEFQGHLMLGAGSWDNYRAELDLSGALIEDGRIRGRVVSVLQDQGSFMDYARSEQNIFYGILEADLTDNTKASLGIDYQQNNNDATTNSHLPTFFTDGSIAKFKRDTNPADKWAYRDQKTQRIFTDLEHRFDNDWVVKATVSHRDYTSKELISGMASPSSTGLINVVDHSAPHGFYVGGAARFNTDTKENGIDLMAKGEYSLFGRSHELVFGYNFAKTESRSRRYDGDTDSTVSDVFNWNNNATKPSRFDWWLTHDVDVKQTVFYAATALKPTDYLSMIVGARVTNYEWSLQSSNALPRTALYDTKVSGEVTPYAGVTLDVDSYHSVYFSYTDIFKPQAYNFNAAGQQLDPLTGKSYEIGGKGEYFDGKLNASIAYFQIKQDNFAILDPSGAATPTGGSAMIAAKGVETRGIELEMSGEVLPRWQVLAGYTYRHSVDANDERVSTNQPLSLFKLATHYRFAGMLNKLSVGGNLNWQNGTYFNFAVNNATWKFEQDAYAVVGVNATYDINPKLRMLLQVNNLFDKHYYSGIGNYNTVFYGAPRNAMLTLRYQF
ncbi:TonB-dependent siderophore receptor [Methylobacillus methanolivorans]|uniref:TonB-dependent siderophore receptor n=1 Tax=Methylobacillus methanolivorans TaxID=1848927 RepID=A0ABW8GNC3_9PROT